MKFIFLSSWGGGGGGIGLFGGAGVGKTEFIMELINNIGGKLSFIISFIFPERLHCCYI